jgi:hypothetical protein
MLQKGSDKKIHAMLLPYETCGQPEALSIKHSGDAIHRNQSLHKISPLTKMLQVTVAPS